MVKKILLSFMGLFFLTSVSFAAEFTASVNRHQIAVGENLLLKLQLSGATAEGQPETSTLKNAFTIIGQQQSSNIAIVNGQMSSSSSWHYTLVPKKEGQYTIPALTLKSSAGTITSRPIAISVSKASSPSSSHVPSSHRIPLLIPAYIPIRLSSRLNQSRIHRLYSTKSIQCLTSARIHSSRHNDFR